MIIGVNGCYNLGIISHLDSQRGAAVERLVDGKDALAAVLERGELEGILVSLSSGVNKKQLIVVVTADSAKAFGKLNLQFIDDRIAVKAKVIELPCQHADIMGMAVADTDDCMTTIEVKIFLTILVPDLAAFALDNVYIIKWIYVECFHILEC